jgi:hypothetical protein
MVGADTFRPVGTSLGPRSRHARTTASLLLLMLMLMLMLMLLTNSSISQIESQSLAPGLAPKPRRSRVLLAGTQRWTHGNGSTLPYSAAYIE